MFGFGQDGLRSLDVQTGSAGDGGAMDWARDFGDCCAADGGVDDSGVYFVENGEPGRTTRADDRQCGRD